MRKKRLPLQALQKAVRDLLTACQTTPIHEHVDDKAKLPFIVFGEISVLPDDPKDTALCTAEMELEIYSGANSRTEVNGILDDVATVLTAVRLDMKDLPPSIRRSRRFARTNGKLEATARRCASKYNYKIWRDKKCQSDQRICPSIQTSRRRRWARTTYL